MYIREGVREVNDTEKNLHRGLHKKRFFQLQYGKKSFLKSVYKSSRNTVTLVTKIVRIRIYRIIG